MQVNAPYCFSESSLTPCDLISRYWGIESNAPLIRFDVYGGPRFENAKSLRRIPFCLLKLRVHNHAILVLISLVKYGINLDISRISLHQILSAILQICHPTLWCRLCVSHNASSLVMMTARVALTATLIHRNTHSEYLRKTVTLYG
jgi:hypothetical protein